MLRLKEGPNQEASTPPPPPARTSANIPTLISPSAPPSIPPVWEHVVSVLMKLPSTTAEGQNLRSRATYHSLTSLEDFLMWELDTLQYDAITVCFPSRDTTQPNSLISLKPNSIRHLIMLRKYIHHLVQDSHLSVSCRILGLTAFNSLLQYVNRLVWELCSVN